MSNCQKTVTRHTCKTNYVTVSFSCLCFLLISKCWHAHTINKSLVCRFTQHKLQSHVMFNVRFSERFSSHCAYFCLNWKRICMDSRFNQRFLTPAPWLPSLSSSPICLSDRIPSKNNESINRALLISPRWHEKHFSSVNVCCQSAWWRRFGQRLSSQLLRCCWQTAASVGRHRMQVGVGVIKKYRLLGNAAQSNKSVKRWGTIGMVAVVNVTLADHQHVGVLDAYSSI